MPAFRGIMIGVVGVVLLLAMAACQVAPSSVVPQVLGIQTLATLSGVPTLKDSGDIMWARVPYCTCLATSATSNVASALKEAKLTVTLKELSPRDGWLYFGVIFDPDSVPSDQVVAAIETGGGEPLEGPP